MVYNLRTLDHQRIVDILKRGHPFKVEPREFDAALPQNRPIILYEELYNQLVVIAVTDDS